MTFAPETLRGWVLAYRRDGLDGLEDTSRGDIGVHVLTSEQIELLCALKRQVPAHSIERVIQIAEELDKVPKGLLKRSTVRQVLFARGLSKRPKGKAATDDLDRFEAAWPNDLWQSDMRTGPNLPDPSRPGKRKQTWLSVFLDDQSPCILGAVWSFKNDRDPLMRSFREALRPHGRPLRAYYDNGGPCVSGRMKKDAAITSKGGKKPVYTAPSRPEGHGKIEALNRLIKSSLVAEVQASSLETVDQLNQAFRGGVEWYNREVRGETAEAPWTRWRRGAGRVEYIAEDLLQQAFRFRTTRSTDKAGVFSLFGCRYQVGAGFAKRRLEVLYDPDDLARVDMRADGRFRERVRPLSPEPNRRPKAKPPEAEVSEVSEVQTDE